MRARRTVEIADLFPRQGQWTESDYFSLPDSNRIVELSDGWVVMPEMPTTAHQRAVFRLARLMADHVEAQGLGEVAIVPLRVRLWPGKIREPDIIFMRGDHADRVAEDAWGVPDLVVEVLSPRTDQSSGTEHTDRIEKFAEYAAARIAEYWLVDTEARTVEVFVLRDNAYHLRDRWDAGGVARSEVLPDLTVPVEAVMP